MDTAPTGNGRLARSIRGIQQDLRRVRILQSPGTLVTNTPRGQFVRATATESRGGASGLIAVVVFL